MVRCCLSGRPMTRAILCLSLLVACGPPRDGADDPPVPDDSGESDAGTHTDSDPGHDSDVSGPSIPALCVEDDAIAGFGPRMAADLETWSDGVVASDAFLQGRARLDALDALGSTDAVAASTGGLASLMERGAQRLAFGRLAEAIEDLTRAESLAVAADSPWRGRVREVLAAAWMRQGEVENCSAHAGGSACIMPFDAQAEHQLPTAMMEAMAVLDRTLAEDGQDRIGLHWMLNVAHMALGTWPDAVPAFARFPAAAFETEAAMPRWDNVGPGSAFDGAPSLSGAASVADVDGDGRLDLVFSSSGPRGTMSLWLSKGDGTYCEASKASGLIAIPGVLHARAVDVDNDGDVDLIAPRGAWLGDHGAVRPSLLINDGEGRFTDRAVVAGLANVVGPSQVVEVADIDGDGWLDLFVGREASWTSGDDHPSSLYRNAGDGTFVDVTASWGIEGIEGIVKGAAFGDVDDDGDPDLYVSRFDASNVLFRNTGSAFEAVDAPSLAAPTVSFSTWFFDPDQDGDLDLYVAAYSRSAFPGDVFSPVWGQGAVPWLRSLRGEPPVTETARLFLNEDGVFTDATAAFSLDRIHAVMGASHGDLDADGYPDVFLGNGAPGFEALEPNTMLRNVDGTGFVDVTVGAHVGHLQKGHGIAFADLDEDGDQDLVAEMGGFYPGDSFPNVLFRNPHVGASSVTLELVGVQANRDAIGARVRVVTPERTLHHTVSHGGSFGGNSLRVAIGLGTATSISRVEVDWPGGDTETVSPVPVDRVVRVEQGRGVVSTRPYRPTVLGGDSP